MYWLLSLVLAGVARVRGDCNYIMCVELNAGVCAENSGQADISINSSGCSGGGYCSYQMVESWMNTVPRSQQLTCSPTSTLTTMRVGNKDCPLREVSKDFVSGSTLVQCSSPGTDNPECLLQDNTFTACVCGLDRKSYCVPNVSAHIFDDYWAECFKSGQNYGHISDDDHYWYWHYKLNYFLPYLTAYSCARKLFEEFTKIDDLTYSADAATLAAGVMLIALSS